MIDITGVDLCLFVQEAYNLSSPQGAGYIHFVKGNLTQENAQSIIDRTSNDRIAVSMDYILGRAVKMTVFHAPNGRLSIDDNWFDHTPALQKELLLRCGIEVSR